MRHHRRDVGHRRSRGREACRHGGAARSDRARPGARRGRASGDCERALPARRTAFLLRRSHAGIAETSNAWAAEIAAPESGGSISWSTMPVRSSAIAASPPKGSSAPLPSTTWPISCSATVCANPCSRRRRHGSSTPPRPPTQSAQLHLESAVRQGLQRRVGLSADRSCATSCSRASFLAVWVSKAVRRQLPASGLRRQPLRQRKRRPPPVRLAGCAAVCDLAPGGSGRPCTSPLPRRSPISAVVTSSGAGRAPPPRRPRTTTRQNGSGGRARSSPASNERDAGMRRDTVQVARRAHGRS